MSGTFVLITGAWHGGWARRCRRFRRRRGRKRGPAVPEASRTLYDEVPPHYQDLFDTMAKASGNNSVTLPFEVWQGGFMQDAPEDVQRLVHSLLVPQPMQYFTTAVEPLDPERLGVPITYVLGEDDHALPEGEYGWARFAERLGVTPVMTPGSHEACFTRPTELAESFLKI